MKKRQLKKVEKKQKQAISSILDKLIKLVSYRKEANKDAEQEKTKKTAEQIHK